MQSVDKGAFAHYTQQYQQLFHDQRLYSGFQATLRGMLASGGCKNLTGRRHFTLTTCTRHSERRIRRLVHGGNKRASLEADTISKCFTSTGAQRLAGADEVLVILNESDLRKPHSSHLEHLDHLDHVRSLTGTSVHGYHTLTALGTGLDGTRALLYHTSSSTQTHDFKSKNTEYRKAINQVADALKTRGVGRVLWVLDRGFDMIDLLKYLERQGQKFVVRLAYLDRRVKLDFKQPARPVLEVLKDAPLQATMQVNRLLFDEKAKRRADVQVQVYGQQVFLPNATTLPLTAVRADAGTKVEAGCCSVTCTFLTRPGGTGWNWSARWCWCTGNGFRLRMSSPRPKVRWIGRVCACWDIRRCGWSWRSAGSPRRSSSSRGSWSMMRCCCWQSWVAGELGRNRQGSVQ